MNNISFDRDVIAWAGRGADKDAFLDFEWQVLHKFGFPVEIADPGFSSKLLIPEETQVVIRPSRGVRQGYRLSPAIFALFRVAEPLGALIVGAPSILPSLGCTPSGCCPLIASPHSWLALYR
jgi:hypothetical protein